MATVLLPKQRLKDYCRRKRLSQPRFILTDEQKIKLHKHYTIQVSINDIVTAEGRGLSRRIAEFKAALNALNVISQNDPSILENHGGDKYNRSFGRSYSLDQITRNSRSDSSFSITNGQFSASPSIDGIYPLNENDDFYQSRSKETVNYNTLPRRHNLNGIDEEALSDSLDEGVFVESSESSSSPAVSSPASPATSRSISDDQIKVLTHKLSTTSIDSKNTKPKKSSLWSSLFLLSSLRAIRHRSSSRKLTTSHSKSYNVQENEFTYPDSSSNQNLSRPTSSSSSESSSSTASSSSSSAFSYSSSSTHSSTSGSFTIEETNQPKSENGHINGYTHLITESIIEEDEENEEMEKCCSIENFANSDSNSASLSRSSSSYLLLNNKCPHNHFSIYGPALCSNIMNGAKSFSMENVPSAALLRYCVRMYLPLPYYDIRFDHKFYVTCRILITTSKSDIGKLPIKLTEEFKDREFTARGNGETLHIARNLAAQSIITQLKKNNIFYE